MTINEYIAGAIGGVTGIIIGHPFDTTKIQLQTRTSGDHRIKNTMDALRSIRQEGWKKGFYRGMAFPVASYAVVNSAFFGVYGNLIKVLQPNDQIRPSNRQVYLAGCVAGGCQLILACPVDVVKCTLQAQIPLTRPPEVSSNTIDGIPRVIERTVVTRRPLKYYTGPLACTVDILQSEGYKGLYKGFWPMFVRDVPSFGLYLLVYETMFHHMKTRGLTDDEGRIAAITAGGFAGCASWAVVMPVDVIKSRLQVDQEGRYKGFMDCAYKTVQGAGGFGSLSGICVLFRGFTITMVRAFPVNAVTFLIYSELMKQLDLYNPPASHTKWSEKHF